MTLTLHPYPAYRPSVVSWLADVPEHWEVRRTKFLYRELDERSSTGSEELMSVSHKTGVTPRKQNVTMFLAESNVGYKVCRPGDIVVNTMWAYMAALGVARQEGLVSPSYGVYRPISHAALNDDFVDSLLRTEAYRSAYLSRSTGITASRLRLYPESFLDIPLLYPPLPEQCAIVRYLDHADRRIRRYVTAKRKLTALLEEEKQAVVNRAVTRGLDPNVHLKPSGVEWLGDVPEHWEITKIKNLARSDQKSFVDGDWIESPYITSDGIRLIQTGNVGIGEYREKGFRYISEETCKDFTCTEFQPGDVLICRLGEPVARACLAPQLGKRMITSVDVCILKPRDDVNAQLVVYCMSSRQYLDWVGSLVRGSTRDRISRSMLGTFPIPLPPLQEQATIVEYLDKATADIGAAIARHRRQIELLQEYRTRLIADVVTGKLDVREAAAQLPDETDDQDPIEEGGPLADGVAEDLHDPDESAEELAIEREVIA